MIHFFIIHDPTTLNRQGPDIGEQYKSILFYNSEDEKEIIQRMIHGEFAFYYNGYEGRYNLYLKDDMVVLKALEIFADESQYLSILSNTESTEVASVNN